jgi:hypothetical protein
MSVDRRAVAAALAAVALTVPVTVLALDADLEKALRSSTYVYISTERKDQSFGKPAEIWFLFHQGAIWVASPPTTWRVKRIKAGRSKAKIAVGKPEGPSFRAIGSLSKDTSVHEVMFKTFAEKYADRWKGYEQRFRDGLKDGSRVLIKYDPMVTREPLS